jgi:hypothetical protein
LSRSPAKFSRTQYTQCSVRISPRPDLETVEITEHTEGNVHVGNVPSPAATAYLAIARYILDTVVKRESGALAVLN